MNDKLLLVNCLAALHAESLTDTGFSENTTMLINKALASIKIPDLVSEADEKASLVCLHHIISGIISGKVAVDTTHILHNVRLGCPFDGGLRTALEQMFASHQVDNIDISKTVYAYTSFVRHMLQQADIKKTINKASYLINSDNTVDIAKVAKELSEDLAVHQTQSTANTSSLIASASTDAVGSFSTVFEDIEKELAGAVLKTGWIRFNKMCGIKGGLALGEGWCSPALPHNCKTLFSLSLSLSLGICNDASLFVRDGRKPMILDITLENTLQQNFPIAYQILKENLTGEPVDMTKVNPAEADEYIRSVYESRGWRYVFEHHDSSKFTMEVLKSRVEYFESLGYVIVFLRMDYAGVMNKEGLSNGQNGSEFRELYRRACIYAKIKRFVFWSPHQLSPAAKAFAAMDPTYVKKLPGKGMTDGCTTIDNEVDGECYHGKTIVGDNTYLEIQRGKHRTIVDTPIKHRYLVLKFGLGVLPWDFLSGVDKALNSVNEDNIKTETDDYLMLN